MTIGLDEYLTVAEAAALLKVHRSTIRRWIAQGELPAYRVGQRRLALKRAEVARLIRPVAPASATQAAGRREGAEGVCPALPPEEQERARAELAAAIARRAEIPPLTPEERERGLRAMEEAQALSERILRERNGELFSPSWEIINEFRDERSRQLS
jgi:excisionase family DNA binding protein